MARTLPFFSVNAGARPVFHLQDVCGEGKRIQSTDLRFGQSGRRLCDECASLNAAENRPRESA